MEIGEKYIHAKNNTIFEITDEFSAGNWILAVYPPQKPEFAIENLMLDKMIMGAAINDGRLNLCP